MGSCNAKGVIRLLHCVDELGELEITVAAASETESSPDLRACERMHVYAVLAIQNQQIRHNSYQAGGHVRYWELRRQV